ncbi:DUF3696 domain-containing protein [Nocardia salmonicida]|uniref:DUF3696 domain-containing protein n=1 Tax=Nocardia salmonicida TaxID=53431 RepID=UPI00368E2060
MDLLDSTRGFGAERGLDLVFDLVYLRWRSFESPKESAVWAGLTRALTDDDLAMKFAAWTHHGSSRDDLRIENASRFASTLRKLLGTLQERVRTPGIAAEVFEATAEERSRLGKLRGECDTPAAVAELMTVLTVRPGDYVYDPACGYATGLVTAARNTPDVRVFGCEINAHVAHRARQRLEINGIEPASGDESILIDDAFQAAARVGHFDVVLVQPPWGVIFTEAQSNHMRQVAGELRLSFDFVPKGSDLAWLLLALGSLRPGGRAAVVLSSTSLDGRHHRTTEQLLALGAVEALVSLPAGLFSHTRTGSVLWLLRAPAQNRAAESVLIVDLQSFGVVERALSRVLTREDVAFVFSAVAEHRRDLPVSAAGHLARSVPIEEIDNRAGLWPQRYLEEPPVEAVVHPAPARTLLTELRLSNFKAFGPNTRVPLAPLTLVYGANSAGKSSLLQALLLLKQSRHDHRLNTQGSLVNAGAFRALVHRQAAGTKLELGVSYGVLPDWIPAAGTADPSLQRTTSWVFEADPFGQGVATEAWWRFGEHHLCLRRDPQSPQEFSIRVADLRPVLQSLAAGTLLYPSDENDRKRTSYASAERILRQLQNLGIEELSGRASGLLFSGEVRLPRGIAPSLGGPIDPPAVSAVDRVARLAGGISQELEQLLDSLVWLGPLRSPPQRVYDRAATSQTSGDGRHIAFYMFDHPSVVEELNLWLERLNVPYVLDVIPVAGTTSADLVGDLVAISLRDNRSNVTVTPADVGFGISQILPVVVELLARRDCVIAVEQPETHLHPRLQAHLADLFIDTTRSGGRGNQLIVETHSEHLMLRVQRRIREGSLDPATVGVLYVDQNQAGETTVRQLRLTEQGEFIDEWPDGFFDDRLSELFAGY